MRLFPVYVAHFCCPQARTVALLQRCNLPTVPPPGLRSVLFVLILLLARVLSCSLFLDFFLSCARSLFVYIARTFTCWVTCATKLLTSA